MFEEIKNIKCEKNDLLKFGITMTIFLIIISGLLFWNDNELYQIFFLIGTILLVISLTLPLILKPAYWIWMIFASILGWIMTRVILSLLFYTIMTPIGLISRLFGKQFLELKWDKSKESYWNIRDNEQHLQNEKYEKQF